MKTLKVVVVIALACGIGHAQNKTMAENTYALKGPVRTFRMEVATFASGDSGSVEGPKVLQLEAEFNKDGNRTDLRIYNDKGVQTRRIVTTFEGRRTIEANNYDGDGKMWLRTVYLYDEAGQGKGSTTYNGITGVEECR